jgi:Integrase core domain
MVCQSLPSLRGHLLAHIVERSGVKIDFGERLVEIGGSKVRAYLFIATLGFSRRHHIRAFRNERQESWFDGLESAFAKFGGVTEEVLFDNARALVVEHDPTTRTVAFNDKLKAFAKHWGFRPRACAPYRAGTKGKTENGVGYVKCGHSYGCSFGSPRIALSDDISAPGQDRMDNLLKVHTLALPSASTTVYDGHRDRRTVTRLSLTKIASARPSPSTSAKEVPRLP